MPNESLAKDFEFKNIVSEWLGYNSTRDKTNVAENVYVRGSQNIYKTLSGTLAVRPGQKRRGAVSTTIAAVNSEYVWQTSWGATYPVWVTNSTLQVEIGGVWYTLLSSLTKTRYVFDKWWDNVEKKDRLLFVKGDADIQHWSGGVANVLSSTLNTITKTGTGSWQAAGFSTTAGEKKIMIAGTEYTYTGGEATTTLTGVSPDPSAIPTTTIAIQSVITTANTPVAGFLIDFIKVINNQAYLGSYTSRLCYISKNTDFKNYTVPTPRAPGDPELLTLDDTLKGIGVRQGKAHIGVGVGSWAVVAFKDITVGSTLTQVTNVDVKPVSALQGLYGHEFVDTVGDNLVYLAQDNQVRMFGDFNNAFTPKYPSISQQIATELSEQNFAAGALKCIGEFTYLTAPNSGKVYLYQVRETVDVSGQTVSERMWHSPFIWNVTRIDEIDGVVHGFSNSNPQVYELWDTDQWYDDCPAEEQLPYRCVLALSYRTGGRRQGLQVFDKVFSEGYIQTGTPLNVIVNYNYEGVTKQIEAVVNSDALPAYTFAPIDASLGDSSLGDEPLGDGTVGDTEFVPKFKVINSLAQVDCFEYQPVFYSDAANARWEILAVATNARQVTKENAVFIINKQR